MAVIYYNNYEDTTNWSFGSPVIQLAQNAEVTYTVPGAVTETLQAIFEYNDNSNVIVALNSTASVPGAGLAVTTGRMEYKPFKRVVNGGDVLHFITPDTTAFLGVSFRQTP